MESSTTLLSRGANVIYLTNKNLYDNPLLIKYKLHKLLTRLHSKAVH